MAVLAQVDASEHRAPLTLLVDRDADTRRMYAEFLILSSCSIEEAEDGREALAKAIARRPDIVVTETRLPGINGYDLTARFLAWGAQTAARGGLQRTGALGPVDGFGLDALEAGCAEAGLARVP